MKTHESVSAVHLRHLSCSAAGTHCLILSFRAGKFIYCIDIVKWDLILWYGTSVVFSRLWQHYIKRTYNSFSFSQTVLTALVFVVTSTFLMDFYQRTHRVPESSPSTSGPWDLIFEKISLVVNEERDIIFWSHLNFTTNQKYDVCRFKRQVCKSRKYHKN